MWRRSQILIRVAQGRFYAIILGKLRKEADSDASRTRVVEVRFTKKEDTHLKIKSSFRNILC